MKLLTAVSLTAACIAAGSVLTAAENHTPVMKIGIVSDVQGLPSRHEWGMRNLALALDQLKSMQIDVLLNIGDQVESADPAAYKLYWELIEERFGKDKLAHVACEGNHEFNHPAAERFQEICKGLRRSTDNPLCVNIKGYDFIALSYNGGKDCYTKDILSRLDAALQKSVARDPGKPIFLLSHFPPADTMSGSYMYDGAQAFREVLNKYPQVVALSGHTHYPLNDDRCLWQGEFNAFTCGTLSYGCMDGSKLFNCHGCILPFAREAAQFLRMDVFADRVEIHRYNAIEGKEIAADKLWKIAIPYKPQDVRKPGRQAPEFAQDAQLLTRYDYGFMYVAFDRPVKGDFAHYYDVEISAKNEDGTFAEPVVTRYAGDFYRLEKNRQDMIFLKLPGKGMKDAAWYRIRVYAVESYGKRSVPLEIVEYTWPGYPFYDGRSKYPQE